MSDWIVNIASRPQAPARVILFPHAGGQAGFYQRALRPDALPDADIHVVQPPGRAERSHEHPITDLTRLTRMTARELVAIPDDRPTALLGHSSGGIYAFEVSRALHRAGRAPALLGVSAIPAPDHPYWDDTLPALLADPGNAYRRLGAGAIPGELEHDTTTMTAFTTLIRADAHLYRHLGRRQVDAVPYPISTFAATADLLAPPASTSGWHAWTTATHNRHHYDGDHFYVRDQLTAILHALLHDLTGTGPVRTVI
ncbi:thioesterase II family protein [Nonomuraea endophytica]|uniref:thioesterase II family protein n=1 Tax=Nonomuraea endophytica TaxID=714136 RepID=UPI0037CA4A96